MVKGNIVFKEGDEVEEGTFYVILSTDLKSGQNKKFYAANTIIEETKVYKNQKITFS